MKRWLTIGGVLIVLGIAAGFALDWRFFMLTGRFTPRKIVERLDWPVAITNVTEAGLVTSSGSVLPLPGVSKVIVPAAVTKDIIEHGVELKSDGTVCALVRVHHWCGNDPVRFHLGRVDMSSLLLVLGNEERPRVSEYGVDPGVFGMATTPHDEVKSFLKTEVRR